MKKRIRPLLLIAAFLSVLAASPASAAETLKIGIFDLQKVIASSKTVERHRQQLAKDAETKSILFAEKQRAARQIEEKLQKEGAKLDPSERKALEEKLLKEKKELQRMKEDVELELKKEDRDLTEKTLKAINAVVEQIYEKEGYSVVFEKNAAGVLKFRSSLDITDKVVKAYDAK